MMQTDEERQGEVLAVMLGGVLYRILVMIGNTPTTMGDFRKEFEDELVQGVVGDLTDKINGAAVSFYHTSEKQIQQTAIRICNDVAYKWADKILTEAEQEEAKNEKTYC